MIKVSCFLLRKQCTSSHNVRKCWLIIARRHQTKNLRGGYRAVQREKKISVGTIWKSNFEMKRRCGLTTNTSSTYKQSWMIGCLLFICLFVCCLCLCWYITISTATASKSRMSSHRCGFEPSSGHMWDKPSHSLLEGGPVVFLGDLPFSPHLMTDLAQHEWNNLDGIKKNLECDYVECLIAK